MTRAYLPVGYQQLLDGLALAGGGIKDGLHVQFLQVLMLLVPPAPEGVRGHVGARVQEWGGVRGLRTT